MDPFHDRRRVWLRSREHGPYLHADKDGHGVSLSRSRASMNAAWVVHRFYGNDQRVHVLLHSAAYGRYLAATRASAPLGCPGFRVEQRNYDDLDEQAVRWHIVNIGDDDFLGYIGCHHYGYLRANGRHLPWNDKVVSVDHVDDFDNISTMMQWVVVPIPITAEVPRLPRPTRFRLRLAESLSALLPTRTVDFIGHGQMFFANPVAFRFRGRSVFLLRNEVARRVGNRRDDLVMYVRAGIHGRFTPLVVNLPRSSQTLVITVGPPAPANAPPGYPDVDAE